MINLMQERGVHVLLSTNYFDRQQVEMVARRTNATAVIVPANVGGSADTSTYVDMVSLWVRELARAFREHATDTTQR